MAFSCDPDPVKVAKKKRLRVDLHREAVNRMLESEFGLSDEGCWIWLGDLNPGGYGTILLSPRRSIGGRRYAIHKLSFEWYMRRRTPGLVIRHTCHNRACFNPKHLIEGSKRENTQDMIAAGRAHWQPKKAKKEVRIIAWEKPPKLFKHVQEFTKPTELAVKVLKNQKVRHLAGEGR